MSQCFPNPFDHGSVASPTGAPAVPDCAIRVILTDPMVGTRPGAFINFTSFKIFGSEQNTCHISDTTIRSNSQI